MSELIKSFLSAAACLWLCASMNLYAQEQNVELQFISFPVSVDPNPIELVVGEGKTIKIELPTNSLSPVYRVPLLGSWVIGKTIEAKRPEDPPKFDIYGQTKSIASNKQLVLVVRKGQNNSDGFDLVCFDGQGNGFSGGKYIFLNATLVDVAGDVGGTRFALKPQKHVLIAPKPSEIKEERKYLYITMFFRKGEEATPFYSSTWRFSEKARTIVVFFHDPHTKRLRTHTIRDYLPS